MCIWEWVFFSHLKEGSLSVWLFSIWDIQTRKLSLVCISSYLGTVFLLMCDDCVLTDSIRLWLHNTTLVKAFEWSHPCSSITRWDSLMVMFGVDKIYSVYCPFSAATCIYTCKNQSQHHNNYIFEPMFRIFMHLKHAEIAVYPSWFLILNSIWSFNECYQRCKLLNVPNIRELQNTFISVVMSFYVNSLKQEINQKHLISNLARVPIWARRKAHITVRLILEWGLAELSKIHRFI